MILKLATLLIFFVYSSFVYSETQNIGVIQGQISAQNNGIKGVSVSVRGEDTGGKSIFEKNIITDENGNYSISNVPNGIYEVSIKSEKCFGKGKLYEHCYVPSSKDGIVINGEVEDVNFNIVEGGAIKGKIVKDDGAPLNGALIITDNANPSNKTTITDSNGDFLIEGISSDADCKIRIKPKGYHYFLERVVSDNSLSPGKVYRLPNVVFQSKTDFKNLTGTILLQDQPIKGISRLYFSNSDKSVKGFLIAKNGEFSIELPAGEYVITNTSDESAWKSKSKYAQYSNTISITSNQVKDIDISLSPK